MKNTFLSIFLVVGFLCQFSINPSEAREKVKPGHSSVNTSSADADSSSKPIGVGLAAASGMTFSSTALTGILDLDPSNSIQAFFAIGSTSPFQIAVAGLYKHTVSESQNAGFHLGGGMGLGNSISGTSTPFGLSLSVVGGIHLLFPGTSHVFLHLDGGPNFQIINSESNLSVGGLSNALGLSVIYML